MTWDVVRWSLVALIGAVLLIAAATVGGSAVTYVLGLVLLLVGLVQVARARGRAPD